MKRSVPIVILAVAFLVGGGALTYASIHVANVPTRLFACSTRTGVLSLEAHGRCKRGLVKVTLPLNTVQAGNGATVTVANPSPSAAPSTSVTPSPSGTPSTATSLGPTTLTQEPAFAQLNDLPSGQVGFPANPQPLSSPTSSISGDSVDFYNLDVSGASKGSSTLYEDLISPSQIGGQATHLSSISFCWGEQTTRANGTPNSLSIDGASVVEYTEPAASASNTYYAPPTR